MERACQRRRDLKFAERLARDGRDAEKNEENAEKLHGTSLTGRYAEGSAPESAGVEDRGRSDSPTAGKASYQLSRIPNLSVRGS